MIAFHFKNEFSRKKINEEDSSVSTLLIPQYLIKEFHLKTQKYNGNVNHYLKSLLRRFNSITHSGLIPFPIKLKTEFQGKHQDLKKINFRPRNSDWLELGELSLAFGKSRCWIFVFLLRLDILGLWQLLVQTGFRRVVPTTQNQELKSFIGLMRFSHNFSRGYTIRV